MLESFKHHLQAQGYSVTGPRVQLFRYLQANDPAGLRAIIADNQGMDRASIYRTLTLFRRLGVIQDIITGGRKMIELADTFDSHHHHISCVRCGRSVSVEDAAIEERLKEIAADHGITAWSHQVEISGVCRMCTTIGV
jgi:Fur family ferric uptake transcriptional regulator